MQYATHQTMKGKRQRSNTHAIQRTLFSKNAVCKSSDNERQNAVVVHGLPPNANAVCVLAILTIKVVEFNSIKHHQIDDIDLYAMHTEIVSKHIEHATTFPSFNPQG